jgi:hypothetical protein
MKAMNSAIPLVGGYRANFGGCTQVWSNLGATGLMSAVFILLGLTFGASLCYVMLAAVRATKFANDATVVVTNVPNPSLGNGWEYAFYAAREHSSKAPPKIPV